MKIPSAIVKEILVGILIAIVLAIAIYFTKPEWIGINNDPALTLIESDTLASGRIFNVYKGSDSIMTVITVDSLE